MQLASLIASIPSPSFNKLGPFNLYGLCIAVGVVLAVLISTKRWEDRGGQADDISLIAMWAVPAGVIGSRIYHVATDWKMYQDDWVDAFKITQGGLGIPGGIFAGVLVGLIVVKAKKWPVPPLLDVVAPAIPVAQAMGRVGNYFNQEVFGRPTSLPWGLEIDPANRPTRYANDPTFHPTFLYEAVWNLCLAGLIVVLGKKRRVPPGHLFTIYVLGYAMGRLWVENLRSDNASLVLGLRVNLWMSLVVGAIALIVLVVAIKRAPLVIPESAYRNTAPSGIESRSGDDVHPGTSGDDVVGTDEGRDPSDRDDPTDR